MIDQQLLSSLRRLVWLAACAAFSCLAVSLPADTLLLANGEIQTNVRVTEKAPDGTIKISTELGLELTFTRERYKIVTAEDLLVLKDGSFKVGRLISDDAVEVNFESDGQAQAYPRAEISSVVAQGAAPSTGPRVAEPRAIERAFEFIEKGDFVLAAETVDFSAASSDPPVEDLTRALAEISKGFRADYDQLLSEEKEILAADTAEKIRKSLGSGSLADALPSPLILDENLKTYVYLEALARLTYSRRVVERGASGEYSQARDQIERSLGLLQGFQSYLIAAELNVREERWESAYDMLVKAKEYLRDPPPPGDAEQAQMWTRFHEVNNLYNLRQRERQLQPHYVIVPTPNVTPRPTPPPRAVPIAELPVATPEPTPTPTPTPKEGFEGVVETYLTKPYEAVDEWVHRQAGVPAWQLLIAAVAFWLVFYSLPIYLTNRLAVKGSGAASRWRGKVTGLGLAAFLPMLVAVLKESRSGGGGGQGAPGTAPPGMPAATAVKRPWWKLWGGVKVEIPVAKELDEMSDLELLDHIKQLTKSIEVNKASQGTNTYGLDDLSRQTMQRLIQAVVTLAVGRRASDIHIEPELDGSKIRMRLDGVLYDTLHLPRSLSNAFVSSLKVMADLDIAEKRVSQDGKISMSVDDAEIDLRINTAPGAFAERVTLRILDSRSIRVQPDSLGMDGSNLEAFNQIIYRPSGVIFLTGPTGSGKTTTLCVALTALNDGTRNILTIENPIEYHIKGINQMQVNEVTGFTFAKGLRSILRSDPDVIMVGEIRDKETADTAIDAANTGHLVFTTLHTIDAPTVMPRLLDLGVEPRRAANAVLAAIAQRLARISCPHCKQPYTPDPSVLEQLGMDPEDLVETTFYRGPGCDICHQTGYQGRLGLFEMFCPDAQLREMMEQGKSVNQIREMARRKGMRTLREEGIMRIKQGITNVEEILRTT